MGNREITPEDQSLHKPRQTSPEDMRPDRRLSEVEAAKVRGLKGRRMIGRMRSDDLDVDYSNALVSPSEVSSSGLEYGWSDGIRDSLVGTAKAYMKALSEKNHLFEPSITPFDVDFASCSGDVGVKTVKHEDSTRSTLIYPLVSPEEFRANMEAGVATWADYLNHTRDFHTLHELAHVIQSRSLDEGTLSMKADPFYVKYGVKDRENALSGRSGLDEQYGMVPFTPSDFIVSDLSSRLGSWTRRYLQNEKVKALLSRRLSARGLQPSEEELRKELVRFKVDMGARDIHADSIAFKMARDDEGVRKVLLPEEAGSPHRAVQKLVGQYVLSLESFAYEGVYAVYPEAIPEIARFRGSVEAIKKIAGKNIRNEGELSRTLERLGLLSSSFDRMMSENSPVEQNIYGALALEYERHFLLNMREREFADLSAMESNLSSGDEFLVRNSLYAIGDVGSMRQLERVKAFWGDERKHVRDAAHYSFVAIVGSNLSEGGAWGGVDYIADSGSESDKKRLCSMLSGVGVERIDDALARLKRMASDEEGWVRKSAIYSMGVLAKRSPQKGLEAIAPYTLSEDDLSNTGAVLAVMELGSEHPYEAVSALGPALASSNPSVRLRSAWAIEAVGLVYRSECFRALDDLSKTHGYPVSRTVEKIKAAFETGLRGKPAGEGEKNPALEFKDEGGKSLLLTAEQVEHCFPESHDDIMLSPPHWDPGLGRMTRAYMFGMEDKLLAKWAGYLNSDDIRLRGAALARLLTYAKPSELKRIQDGRFGDIEWDARRALGDFMQGVEDLSIGMMPTLKEMMDSFPDKEISREVAEYFIREGVDAVHGGFSRIFDLDEEKARTKVLGYEAMWLDWQKRMGRL